jgi:NAD-dependent SIR2 family protein deacetylase
MDMKKLVQMIRESNNIVFFGGAGVSTESGVKDYRSKDGLYNTVKDYGVPPEKILSRSFFRANPDVFYDLYSKLCDICNADELSSPETEKALLDLIDRMHSELLLPRKESLNKWQQQDSGL